MPPKPASKPAAPAAKPAAKPATNAPAKKPAAPAPAKNTQKPAQTSAPAKSAPKAAPAPAAKTAAQNKGAAPAKERKEHAGIYIKGIPATERLEEIKKVFKVAGNIIAARRRGSKYCLLWFDNPAAVRKAVDTFHNKFIHSHKVTVHQAKASPPVNPADVCKTVYVGGLGHDVKTRAQIRSALTGCGEIIKIRLYRGGRAFVYFKDVKGANKARNDYDGKKLLGSKVKVALSYRTKERDALMHRRGLNRTKVYAALREIRSRKLANKA